MAVVRSPKLTMVLDSWHSDGDWLCKADLIEDNWLCVEELSKFIHIPKAKFYWLEANTQQWKDRSGCRVEVYLAICRSPKYRLNRNTPWLSLAFPLIGFLQKLGLTTEIDFKTVYFRLLYQE